MSQIKAQTFLEKCGFKDDDLKTPEHDRIVLDLMNAERMSNIISSCYSKETQIGRWAGSVDLLTDDWGVSRSEFLKYIWELFSVNTVDKSILDCKLNISDLIKEYEERYYRKLYGSHSNISNEEKEKITQRILQSIERVREDFKCFINLTREVHINSECPITKGEGEYKTIIGYVDFMVTLRYPETIFFSSFERHRIGNENTLCFFIEVKPKITSFGETQRQMKTYMTFTKAYPILVTQTTQKIKEAFESQGIRVYLYPDNKPL